MTKRSTEEALEVVGLDVSDRSSTVSRMSMGSSEILERTTIATSAAGMERYFAGRPRMRVALEAGTHSPWISRQLEGYGHEVVVGNPALFQASVSRRKSDRSDADGLVRVARLDPSLLHPVRHRSAAAQRDLAVVRSRHALVRARTQLINECRGQVKSYGHRLPSCSAQAFAARASAVLPEDLRPALDPLLEVIAQLSAQIRGMERTLETLARQHYPQTLRLRQVCGVGTLTALSFILILDDPQRFARPRHAGAYLGLVPGRRQSGERSPHQPITKQGDPLLRQLLVQAAHYILGPFGPDCDLRRFGQRLIDRGGGGARCRAAVAVARRLAVLLLHLWRSGDEYDPFFVEHRRAHTADPAATDPQTAISTHA